ncbi:TetR/AcrR family transcriptional regulator [Microbacterium sp. 1.5R]|uniref:TetR/AcrR family transcriptional regulator n=1 Tax=Microbacterium sp. 1.5R TaxID=1916917 RepID=UPI00119D227E|nr:TetR/AcrR family transcriptional regulator [Microbacterium sp. 1.5R]
MDRNADSTREQRKRKTARALTEAARRLTAEHGFAGFTIEQLCADAGVSRRTFFNYFESKENAVFGVTAVDPRQEALEREFVGADGELLDDFIRLTIDRFALLNPLEDAPALFAVIEQEPRLIRAAFDQLAANERRDVDLIVERSGDAPDVALQAEVMVHTVGALVRLSMDQLLHHHSGEAFGDLVARRLDAARTVFAQKAD